MTPDRWWMERAIALAHGAQDGGQRPYGAVVIGPDAQFVAEGHNLVVRDHDPSAHAEVVAIRRAGLALGSPSLAGCTIYCTCEPCLMCSSLILSCGIARVIYGARATDGPWPPPLLGIQLKDVVCWANNAATATAISITPDFMRDACLPLYTSLPT